MIADATERQRAARFLAVVAACVLVVFALDAATKTAAAAALAPGEAREVVPGWLVLTHVRNTGAAYGLLAGHGWLLTPLSLAAAVIVPLVVWRARLWQSQPSLGGLAAGLILGGALGNLVERLRSGAVTDFLHVPSIPLFQVFNVSDAAICVGAALLLLLANTQPAKAASPDQSAKT